MSAIDRINTIMIAEDFAKLKAKAKDHGITPLMMVKMLINNYDESLDKVEQFDAKGKYEFERVCLALGEETTAKLNEIATSHGVSPTTVLRCLIRGFVDENRPPRKFIVLRHSGPGNGHGQGDVN